MRFHVLRKDAAPKPDETIEAEKTSDDTQPDAEYPPFKVVLPTVLSLYLAVFLVALVRSLTYMAESQLM